MSDVQKLIAEARAKAVSLQGCVTVADKLGTHSMLLVGLADALEAATAPVKQIRPNEDLDLAKTSQVEPDSEVVERVARHLANLDDGESWPGNSELGGSLTGTRDDEYRAAMQEEAREILELIGFSSPVGGETSDGYHTFDELYEFRMLYHRHAVSGWLAAGVPVVKSWRHSDGEECFGGGWFVVVASLPAGQVSNHYPAEDWGLFEVPEVEIPPAFDGHTSSTVVERLRGRLPVGGGTEYRAILGPVSGEERVTIPGAVSAYLEALEEYPFEFEDRGRHPIILARQVTPWSLVSPEQDGERIQREADDRRVRSTRDVIREAQKKEGK